MLRVPPWHPRAVCLSSEILRYLDLPAIISGDILVDCGYTLDMKPPGSHSWVARRVADLQTEARPGKEEPGAEVLKQRSCCVCS